jgi:putative acetyltransferase
LIHAVSFFSRIVPLEEAHIPRLLDLFEQSVRRLGPAHYSPEQVEQWARGAHHPGLASQLREHHGWVIEQDDVPLGFATLSDDGHLSLLYVSADHPRQGSAPCCWSGCWQPPARWDWQLTTEASAFSLALFLRHGFLLTGLETVERGGVQFIRHRLHCRLP